MRRYRAPQPPRSRYITPEGQERLSRELQHLWKTKRPQVTQAVAEAAAMGDRSENAEYIYGKKQLREIDARIRFLSKRLEELLVVDRTPEDEGTVYFGAWVRLEDEEGELSAYRIVGPDEIDAEKGYISIDSPMARALLKKAERDEVTVERPRGRAVFTIVEVRYRPFDGGGDGGREISRHP
ncbi:MAG: transcription elongation factor GreB [Thermodesulfovibrionales bacterium]